VAKKDKATKSIRLNANAAIVKNGKILLIEFKDENGIHYNLPGGGVDPGESIAQAVKRECMEEALADIEVGRLLLVWEYVPEHHDFIYGPKQKVGQIFECKLKKGSTPRLPKKPDKNQVGVKWIPLRELVKNKNLILYPAIKKELTQALKLKNQSIRVISHT
jgi:ADP-ribose pyrophosphatase YjhB (NUDIX family)